jgi:hypothetical protein
MPDLISREVLIIDPTTGGYNINMLMRYLQKKYQSYLIIQKASWKKAISSCRTVSGTSTKKMCG